MSFRKDSNESVYLFSLLLVWNGCDITGIDGLYTSQRACVHRFCCCVMNDGRYAVPVAAGAFKQRDGLIILHRCLLVVHPRVPGMEDQDVEKEEEGIQGGMGDARHDKRCGERSLFKQLAQPDFITQQQSIESSSNDQQCTQSQNACHDISLEAMSDHPCQIPSPSPTNVQIITNMVTNAFCAAGE